MNIDTNRPIVNHLSGTLADFVSPGAVSEGSFINQ